MFTPPCPTCASPPVAGRLLRGGGVALVALAALVSAPAARAVAAPVAPAAEAEFRTEHVVVRGDVGEESLRAWARLAEAAYPQWKAFFGVEPPKNRLPLELDARTSREGFLHAVHKVGVVGALPGAGGYYDPKSRRSFLYLQPHESSTRLLVLHECLHQYQYKALQDDVPDRSPIWHREGLAEHFGYHRRTATGVELGALDMVAIDDRPRQCADRVKSGKFDAWAVGTGALPNPDYVDAMTLVETFLRTTDKGLVATYHAWEREIYKTGNAHSKFEKLFQPKKARLLAAVSEVWGAWVSPWEVGYIAWDEEPGAIVGTGMPWAILVGRTQLPLGNRWIEAEIELGKNASAGGIALGVKDKEHLIEAELRADGTVLLRRRVNAQWTELGQVPATGYARGKSVRLRLEFVGLRATLSIDGVRALEHDLSAAGLTLLDVDGAAGLTAETADVRFRSLRIGGK